ncbi:MAG: hypothetical protein P4L70_10885 [Parasulfuritortus sp.]|nr:hypothetical protein [Parasulfuritortus sp.]
MSSCISSSEPHRRFVIGLLVLIFAPINVLFALGIYLQPLDGDLTRIGYYPENNYGWNKPQLIFPHTRLDFPDHDSPAGHYGSYHDVVVIGDSFSNIRPQSQWQNYLQTTTGFSIATLNINLINLPEVLASQTYKESPPKYLIFESAERYLPGNLTSNATGCGLSGTHSPNNGNEEINSHIFSKTQYKNHAPGLPKLADRTKSWAEIKIGFVLKFLFRNIHGDNNNSVHVMELRRAAPFSSQETRKLLVYDDDLKKVDSWKKLGTNTMGCLIQKLRQKVESNGYTRFLLMVPPDKLTAYEDFISDQNLRNRSLLSKLSDDHPEIIPRIDLALVNAIQAGKQDIYLPDDTHWGSSGQQIAAETILSFIQGH